MKAASLRVRVIGWYVGMLALALMAFGLAVFVGIGGYLRNSLERSLESQAEGIAATFLGQAASKGTEWLAGEVAESYAPESSGRFIRITGADGKILYESGDTREPFIDADRIPHQSPSLASATFRQETVSGSPAVLVYAFPYRSPDGHGYLVEVGASRSSIDHTLRGLAITVLLVTPVILIGAAAGGYLLMKQPLKPIAALTEQAEHIGAENFSERLPVIQSGDELERLSLSLNRMLARLEDAIAHIHRFSGDVSHELRTPLTILRGELEQVSQMDGLQPDLANAVWSSLEEVERLSKIVNSLLVISRLDYGDAGMEKNRVDLGILARDTVEQMQALAEDKSISITCRVEAAEVLGDETRLRQVVVNLLDNAIKYTAAGGQIDVRVAERGNRVVLLVSDNGIGIPAEALPHVFERFYRTDKARSRASGGAGLGLSIVKAICSAHNSEVLVDSTEDKGTTVTVELPRFGAANEIRGPLFAEAARADLPQAGGPERMYGVVGTKSNSRDEESSIAVPPSSGRT
jgi:heavy metal sensor kinase